MKDKLERTENVTIVALSIFFYQTVPKKQLTIDSKDISSRIKYYLIRLLWNLRIVPLYCFTFIYLSLFSGNKIIQKCLVQTKESIQFNSFIKHPVWAQALY